MSATAVAPANNRSSLVGPIALGGPVIALGRLIDTGLFWLLLFKIPLIVQWQFIASGLLGEAAFAGGVGTAVLGLVLHLVFATVIAAIFIVAATRLSVLRRNIILGGVLYSVVVYFVMTFVVSPLSATPPPDAIIPLAVVEGIIGHMVLVGLPLALIARRYTNRNM